MLKGLHHLGVAVKNLDEAIPLWEQVTGGHLCDREMVPEQGVEVAVIAIGSLRVELLAATCDDSPVARHIAARGTGIHHVALESASVQEELDRMKASGVKLIDEQARSGAANTLIGFVHPHALLGVLIEVVERKLE